MTKKGEQFRMSLLEMPRWVVSVEFLSPGEEVAGHFGLSAQDNFMKLNGNWPELIDIKKFGERNICANSPQTTAAAFGPSQRRHKKSVGLRLPIW